MVTQQETVGLVRRSRNQSTWVHVMLWSWGAWVWGGWCVHVFASSTGTGRVQTGENYLGCHIHVNTLVSRRIQPEAGGSGCDNQWTCVYVWAGSMGTGRVQSDKSYLGCHIHVDTLVSRRIQPESGGSGCDNQWTCVHVCRLIRVLIIRVFDVVYLQQNKKGRRPKGKKKMSHQNCKR